MKVGAAQIQCVPGDASENLEKVRDFARQAKSEGCDLVVFPEMVDTGYDTKTLARFASSWNGYPYQALREIAIETELCIVAGLSQKESEKLYNAVAVIAPDGAELARYHKIHLVTTEPICEDRVFTRGESFATFTFQGIKFGVMVCYGMRFPEIARHYALEGVSAIVVPTAWPKSRLHHWRALVPARALENQVYLIGANRVGVDGELEFSGGSAIAEPWGEVLATASSDAEELLTASVDLAHLEQVRNFMPLMKHRRPDLY